jgi:uncharacterized protein with PIN domain
VDVPLARVAREAFSRFGKGRHPAGLNLGDFARTDVGRISRLPGA